MPKLNFYDMKKKSSFTTDKFELTTKETSKGTKYFAIADAPSGIKAWRLISKSFYNENI